MIAKNLLGYRVMYNKKNGDSYPPHNDHFILVSWTEICSNHDPQSIAKPFTEQSASQHSQLLLFLKSIYQLIREHQYCENILNLLFAEERVACITKKKENYDHSK